MLLCALSAALHAEEKSLKGVALVIGQSKYAHIAPLANPANDAREMVKLLSDLGFDARSVSDRDAAKLRRDLERFVEDAEGADVAFLYYSGHGIEAGGENWLVPVDADVSSLENAGEDLVPLSEVMDQLKGVVPVTIMLLDACRTNPFPAGALVKKSPADPGAPIGAGGLTPVRGAAPLGRQCAGRRQSRHGDRLCGRARPAGARRRDRREQPLCVGAAAPSRRDGRRRVRPGHAHGDRGGLSRHQDQAAAMGQ